MKEREGGGESLVSFHFSSSCFSFFPKSRNWKYMLIISPHTTTTTTTITCIHCRRRSRSISTDKSISFRVLPCTTMPPLPPFPPSPFACLIASLGVNQFQFESALSFYVDVSFCLVNVACKQWSLFFLCLCFFLFSYLPSYVPHCAPLWLHSPGDSSITRQLPLTFDWAILGKLSQRRFVLAIDIGNAWKWGGMSGQEQLYRGQRSHSHTRNNAY